MFQQHQLRALMYQETRAKSPGTLARPEIMQKAASRWRRGKTAGQPIGSNCIDIDVHWINPTSKKVTLVGRRSHHMNLKSLFPTAVGVFGPILLPVPGSNEILLPQYGKDCLAKRIFYTNTGAPMKMKELRDPSIRRAA